MKRILLVLMTFAILAGNAVAAPICLDQNLAAYVALGAGGCTIGDKLFFNFTYSATATGGAVAPTAADVQIADLPGDGVTNPGLLFSASWAIFTPQTMDATIGFSVTAGGGFLIKDASLLTTANLLFGVGGIATVTETLNNGVTPIPGSPLTTALGTNTTSSVNFITAGGTNLSTLNVSTAIHVASGQQFSGVSLSAVQENFSQLSTGTITPEPVETLLIGSGFVLLGLVKLRKRGPR